MLSMIMIITKTYCRLKGKHTQRFDKPRRKVLLAPCRERHVATGVPLLPRDTEHPEVGLGRDQAPAPHPHLARDSV